MNPYIFVADSSNTNLTLAKDALSGQYEVITLTSIAQMFKLLERIIPEAILLNIQMPGIDLHEVMERLQKDRRHSAINIVFMSKIRCPERESEYYRMGCSDFILLPFNSERLLTRIMNCAQKPEKEPTVLVVDDNPFIISTLGKILRPYYRVLAARDGGTSLKQVQKHAIHLILLDINMPNMSGFDVIRALKADTHTKDIPVIFITASDKPEDQVEGLAEGAVDFIRKPFSPEQVLRSVGLHIRKEATR